MRLFPLRLRRRAPRHYALLDEAGRCRMLCSSLQRPQGAGWVEVSDACLGWLDRPLPAGVRAPGRPAA